MKKEQISVPKLRFSKFTDSWNQQMFSEFTWSAGKRNKDDLELVPYAVTNDRGFIPQSEAHDDFGYMQNVDRKAYNIVPPKSFAYNPARINVGSIGYYDGTDNVIVSSLYEVFQTADYVDDRFLWHWIKSDIFPKWIEKLQEGSVRLYFYYDKLCECHIQLPSIDEQRQISAFLDKHDTLISLQQRKLDQIKEYKKGMLQKMFPKEGESVPEVRFPGFTGEWEQRKLNEISDIVTGTTPPTKDKDNYGGDRLFVSPADIQGNRYVDETNTTLTEKGYTLCRELRGGATLFVSIGSTIGKVAQIKESATTNQQINAVIPYDEMDDDFVFTMLENEADEIRKLVATQAVPIINKTTFGETEVKFPKKDEQKRIGDYFRDLDTLITLHQRKLDAMKEYKKGLLQQMFV